MIADAVFASGFQLIFFEIEAHGCHLSQILFDHALVLRRGRNEAGIENRAVRVELVAMIENAAGRLGAGAADAGPRPPSSRIGSLPVFLSSSARSTSRR